VSHTTGVNPVLERQAVWGGVGFALAAGCMWGLVFVAPLLLPQYPAIVQSLGRYVAFGLVSLPLAWVDRQALAQLSRADWMEAIGLTVIGNFLYYFCLASAIQRAGAPLPTMMMGTLPVVIAVCANQLYQQRDGRMPWPKLWPALLIILVGLTCVNHVEMSAMAQAQQMTASRDASRYASGAVLAVVALASWTWYPLRNADWLRKHPKLKPRVWASAQGLVTLPLAVVGSGLYWALVAVAPVASTDATVFEMPWGPQPAMFVGLMLAMGLFSSWLGTLFWNEASQRLPTNLAGQLIVFETLAALAYVYLWRGSVPEPMTSLGIGLLIAGVLIAVRIKPIAHTS
jgi:drug/metabolite transporter (DMT)-like permease